MLNIRKKLTREELVCLLKKNYLVDTSEAEIAGLLSETRDITEKNLLKKRQQRDDVIERIKKFRG